MKPTKNKNENESAVRPESGHSPVPLITAVIVASILFLTACVGWGMYFFQKRLAQKKTTQTEILQSQVAALSETAPQQSNKAAVPGPVKEVVVSEETAAPPESACTTCGAAANQEEAEGFLPPATSEKNMGYIKKIYAKNGKNYLDIDYIQWLYGQEAEKAMREDGRCPKSGECIVYDDYYIRNQNPLIRTFEIAPDVAIKMQTFNSENEGLVAGRAISLETLKSALNSDKQHYQYVPFILELSNQQIYKITEQYIP